MNCRSFCTSDNLQLATLDLTPAAQAVIGLPKIARARPVVDHEDFPQHDFPQHDFPQHDFPVDAMLARADAIAATTRAHVAADTAESAIKAARRVVPVPAPAPETKPAKQHSWWRVSMMLYSGATVIRNVSGKRPTVKSIKNSGWHEVRDDGNEYYVASEAIMTVEIAGGFATNPAATPWHQVNGGK